MQSWSVKKLTPVRFRDFVSLANAFTSTASGVLAQPAEVDIIVMDDIKQGETTNCHESEWADEKNADHTILRTARLSDITESIWRRAKYIEVSVRPQSYSAQFRDISAVAEFKGTTSFAASFHTQGVGESNSKRIMQAVRSHSPRLSLVVSGKASNHHDWPVGLFPF